MSELERTQRLDSEFYSKENLIVLSILSKLKTRTIADVSRVSDGNHMSISDKFQDKGIPYYRGQNIHNFFIEEGNPICIDEQTFNIGNLKRSHLRKEDVLLSIVGTIGGVAVVSTNDKATCNCKLAILRPNGVNGFYLASFLQSKYGQNQIQKFKRGAVQMGLILEDMNQIYIPIFTNQFQDSITELVSTSKLKSDLAKSIYTQAEQVLLSELNLDNFEPSQEPVNVKSFSESFGNSGRLDAEYYQVKYDELEEQIKSSSFVLIKNIRTDNFRGLQPQYVEDGELNVINSKHILEQTLDYDNFEKTSPDYWDEQERARVFKNDILTYTTGANIGRTQVYLIDKKALASNHVNILRLKKGYNPQYTGFVMNSTIGRLQTEKLSAGSAQAELYPKDIDNFLIPIIEQDKQQQIADLVEQSFTLKKQSEHLLEVAKTAVEMAIEQDEKTALAYIQQETKAHG